MNAFRLEAAEVRKRVFHEPRFSLVLVQKR
jgi:hypothetical protein